MAKTKISEYNSNASLNTDINSIDIAEGCAPSGINNAIRELMAQLKDMQDGSSGDTFTFTAIDVNGGAIDGTAIGANSASTGAFTTLSASGAVTIGGNTSVTGTLAVTGNADFTSTGQVRVPKGTTAQRANNKIGSFRYNDTTGGFEGVKAVSGQTISSITNSTTTATLTTASAHGLSTGNFVVVSGASPSAYNGEYAITVTGSTTFTYTMASDPAASASTVGSYVYGLWGVVGGGATGGLNNDIFYENSQTVTNDYIITSGKNAMSAGQITIDTGVTVTVPDNSTWVIV
jgi:hypothetical protein